MSSVVYFIRASATNLIKIGWTDDLPRRLSNLTGNSPDRLEVLATVAGGATLEAHLHDHFSDERAHGEWFISTNRLLDFIDKVKYYGASFIAAGFGEIQAAPRLAGSNTAAAVEEEARQHALVLRDALERRGYSRMASYEAIGRQIGSTSGWVRKLIGRQPGLAVAAHVLLNLREIALSSMPRFASLNAPLPSARSRAAAALVAPMVDEERE